MEDTKKHYTKEAKLQAVQLVSEAGRTAASVAHEMGVHENTVYKWMRLAGSDPAHAFPGSGKHQPLSEEERLKRRIIELEAENDFLKKVSAYFAKSQR